MNAFDNINEAVKVAKLMASVLEPYSFPSCDPDVEASFTSYKTCKFPVDGYDICAYYSSTKIDGNRMSSLQIWCKDLPFLPINVSIKVVNKFFNCDNICLFQLYNNGKFVYCWTKMESLDGEVLRPVNDFVEECKYNQFNYFLINDNFSF